MELVIVILAVFVLTLACMMLIDLVCESKEMSAKTLKEISQYSLILSGLMLLISILSSNIVEVKIATLLMIVLLFYAMQVNYYRKTTQFPADN